jgi:hypothetical protein
MLISMLVSEGRGLGDRDEHDEHASRVYSTSDGGSIELCRAQGAQRIADGGEPPGERVVHNGC